MSAMTFRCEAPTVNIGSRFKSWRFEPDPLGHWAGVGQPSFSGRNPRDSDDSVVPGSAAPAVRMSPAPSTRLRLLSSFSPARCFLLGGITPPQRSSTGGPLGAGRAARQQAAEPRVPTPESCASSFRLAHSSLENPVPHCRCERLRAGAAALFPLPNSLNVTSDLIQVR